MSYIQRELRRIREVCSQMNMPKLPQRVNCRTHEERKEVIRKKKTALKRAGIPFRNEPLHIEKAYRRFFE